MKRILLFLLIICGFINADAQIYQTIPGYGFKWQRISPDSVLHLPRSTDTTLRTSYTTLPQIRMIGDSTWAYTGSRWVNISRGIDSTTLLSKTVRTFGAQSVSGTKTYLDSALFNKPFAAYNNMAIFGSGTPAVKIGYGATSDETQVKIGDSFILKRVGAASSQISSIGRPLQLYSNNVQIYGDTSGAAFLPGNLRLSGNYGLGQAKIGAYNSAASSLVLGNESTNSATYDYEMVVYGRNNRWVINDTTTLPAAQASSILTLTSTKKGFLTPRMTTAQRDAISSPATGLQIYNTTTNRKNYYNGSAWDSDLAAGDTTAMLDGYKTYYPRRAISLTTTGTSGAATYNSATGVLNIPNYSPDLSGYLLKSDSSIYFSNVVRTFGNQTLVGTKTFSSNIVAAGFVRSGGTSSQFLMADGSVKDSTFVSVNGAQQINGAKTFNQDVVINDVTVGRGAGSLSSNTRVGNQAFNANTTGFGNTAIGQTALLANTIGARNTAVGQSALYTATSGNENTAVGVAALQLLTTGTNNVATGYSAMNNVTTGVANVGYGVVSLNAVNTGSYNTAIGHGAGGTLTTGSYNVYVGNNANASGTAVNNEIVIGYSLTGNGSNTVTIGNNSITNNYFNGNLRAGGAILTGALSSTGGVFSGSGFPSSGAASISSNATVGPFVVGNTDNLNLSVVNAAAHRVLLGSGDFAIQYSAATVAGAARIWSNRLTINESTGDAIFGGQVTSTRGNFGGAFSVGSLNAQTTFFVFDSKYQHVRIGVEGDLPTIRTDWFSGAGGALRDLSLQYGTTERIRLTNAGVTISGVLSAGTGSFSGGGYSFEVINPGATQKVRIGTDATGYSSIQGANISNTPSNMTLNPDGGNIGIGVLTPSAKLDVAGTGNFTGSVTVGGSLSSGEFTSNITNGSTIIRPAGGNPANNAIELNIRPNAGKSGYLTFTENAVADRWSIGIQNGNSDLRFIPNFITSSPVVTISNAGAVTATGFIVSSDYRYKNILSQDGDLYSYTLKNDESRRVHYGYIAQDVEKWMPNAVTTNDEGYKAVNYIEVLTYKVRQLEKQIEELKNNQK